MLLDICSASRETYRCPTHGRLSRASRASVRLFLAAVRADAFSLASRASSDSCTTGKSTIADEKKWNVFMRLDTPEAQRATGETDAVKVIAKLREMKNKG
jgi:hypothetical protein